MAEPAVDTRRADSKIDAATFLLSVKRRSGAADIADPLAVVRVLLDAAQATAEGQLLSRLLQTIATGEGAYEESDVWLLSGDSLALACSLIDARNSGLYSVSIWDEFR